MSDLPLILRPLAWLLAVYVRLANYAELVIPRDSYGPAYLRHAISVRDASSQPTTAVLRAALRRYGHHLDDCALQNGGACSCGLSDLRRE